MAGDGGGNAGTEGCKVFILFDFIGVGGGLLDDLGEHTLEGGAFQANRGGFDGKCLRAKGFHLKTVALELVGDGGKNDHLLGLELDQHGHE